MILHNESLEGLAKEFVGWQRRGEAQEVDRSGLRARILELQQQALEQGNTPQALQEAQAQLVNHDQALEAVTAKMDSLFAAMLEATKAHMQNIYDHREEFELKFTEEYRQKCEEAAGFFARAMAIADQIGLDSASLPSILGFNIADLRSVDPHIAVDKIFSESFNAARIAPLNSRDPEWASSWKMRHQDFKVFCTLWHAGGKLQLVEREVRRAIRAAGGSPPVI